MWLHHISTYNPLTGSNCLAQLLSKADTLCDLVPTCLSRLTPTWTPLLRCGGPAAMPAWPPHDSQHRYPPCPLREHPSSSSFLSFQGPTQMPLHVSCHKCNNCPISIHCFLDVCMSLAPFPCVMDNWVGVCLVPKLKTVAGRDFILHFSFLASESVGI